MVEIGNIHNGFLSSLDTFGIIGSIFFILWNLSLLVRIFRVRLVKDDPKTMVIRFLAFYLGGAILFYWIGAPGIGTFLPQEFALAGVFLRLCRSDSSEIEPRHLPNKVMLSRAEAVRA
jgi:O-antigen ligase